jgi:hypothetical protein
MARTTVQMMEANPTAASSATIPSCHKFIKAPPHAVYDSLCAGGKNGFSLPGEYLRTAAPIVPC